MTAEPPAPQGRVITFYSYKGGTGRSMALANVAWILASNRKRVLVIDWDLEAPGLHRYFHPYLPDKDLATTPGLMEFAMEYVSQALTPAADGKEPGWYKAHADIVEYAQSLRWSRFEKPGTLDFIPAGRQCDSYSSTVNLFNWQQFYDKLGGGAFFDAAREYMCAEYDYILIDSRTGVSDTSGICTIQLPDTVVLCFTFNIQSIEGAAAVAAAIEHARQSGSRDIRILPVPTRVDESEKEKVDLARIDAWQKFDRFLWQMTPEERANYWGAVEIPYRPWYAFEEVLATFGDRPRHQSSILASMETLTSFITNGEVTRLSAITEAERLSELDKFVRHRASEPKRGGPDAGTRAEQALARLTPALQERAVATVVRLADITHDEGKFATRRLDYHHLGEVPDRVLQTLRYAELITETKPSDSSEVLVELSGPDVLRDWTRARRAVESDRAFLIWRQTLTDDAVAWDRTKKSSLLLRRERLREGRRNLAERPADLNSAEVALIEASLGHRRNLRIAAIIAVVIPLLVVFGVGSWMRTDSYQIQRVFADAVVSGDDASPAADDATEAWIRALVDAGRIPEARAVVDASRTDVQRAGRGAALASAFHGVRRLAESEAVVTAVTAALKGIPVVDDRTRAKIRVADTLADSHPEKATRLLFEALQSATYDSDRPADDDTSPHGGQRSATAVRLIAAPGGSEQPAAGMIRLGFFRDVILTMQKLRLGAEAARALRDADNALRDVGPRQSAAWLLDLLAAVDGAPDGQDVSIEARRKVLSSIASMQPGTARERDLLAAVQTMTGNGRSCDLVVEALRDPRFSAEEVYGAASIAFRAIARGRTAEPTSPVWAGGMLLARRVGGDREDLLTASIAAAMAACGDPETARRVAAELLAKNERATPARQAAVLAAVSEIQCRSGLDEEARISRQQAVQQALLVADLRSQSETIESAAIIAARCGDIAAAARTSQAAGDPAIVQQALPELVVTMAEAAGVENDEQALAQARRVVVAASQIEVREIRDRALATAVTSLVRASRERAAVEAAKAIEDPARRSDAVVEIAQYMKDAPADELDKLAASIEAAVPRTRARIAVAGVSLAHKNQSAARNALELAERDARQIGDAVEQSGALRDIAIAYSAMDDLRDARNAALACADASDRLRAFAAIVAEWTRQKTE